MQAILYVCHGSRKQEGIESAREFIEKSKKNFKSVTQEIAFLQFAAPNIMEGIKKCVKQGATKIVLIPILLLSANHADEDIPREIEKAQIKYPNVTFTYGQPFGVHVQIIASLYDRIVEQGVAVEKDAHVILVGRGSRQTHIREKLTEIATLFKKTYALPSVDVCFLYGLRPSLIDAIKAIETTNQRQVFIVPYLLFSGVLMDRVKKHVTNLGGVERKVVVCQPLGYHSNLQAVLQERVGELLDRHQVH